MICAVDFAGNIPSNVNHIFFVGLWPTQIDEHRDGVDGVDQGVHEVGEDDEGDVHVLDLFPLEMKESLRERMFEESAVGALDELYEDGDILAPPAVCAVNVGRQLVEIQLDSGVRVQLRKSLQLKAGVKPLLECLHALRDVFVDEEKSGESGVVPEAEVGSVADQ